jgi:hypothetical protein
MASLATNLQTFATRVATEFRSIRSLITGSSTGDLTGLTTTAKANLIAAINEVNAKPSGTGGASNLDGLSDVTVAGATTGHVLRHNGTVFANVLGTTYFDAAGAAAAAQAASQPLDSDLTAIAALATTTYGRALLTLADQAGLAGLLPAASTTVTGIARLATNAETTTGTANNIATTPAGVAAAIAALVNGSPATLDTLNELATALGNDPNFATTIAGQIGGKQNSDPTLTALAALATAADQMIYSTGADTFAMTSLTAFGRSLIDDANAAAARTTLDVYGTTDIGDPNTDFVATFTTALTA